MGNGKQGKNARKGSAVPGRGPQPVGQRKLTSVGGTPLDTVAVWISYPLPRRASASWLRRQQPDATKDAHEAASRPRRLVTAIGWPIAPPLSAYRRACSFIPGGQNRFRNRSGGGESFGSWRAVTIRVQGLRQILRHGVTVRLIGSLLGRSQRAVGGLMTGMQVPRSANRPGRRGAAIGRRCRRGRRLGPPCCSPAVRQEVVELPSRRRQQARQDVLQVRPRLDAQPLARGREAEEHRRRPATAWPPDRQPVLATNGNPLLSRSATLLSMARKPASA
jgi:hypothetical protein